MLMAWQRWQALPPEQKERYTRQAREYAARGRKALDKQARSASADSAGGAHELVGERAARVEHAAAVAVRAHEPGRPQGGEVL